MNYLVNILQKSMKIKGFCCIKEHEVHIRFWDEMILVNQTFLVSISDNSWYIFSNFANLPFCFFDCKFVSLAFAVLPTLLDVTFVAPFFWPF